MGKTRAFLLVWAVAGLALAGAARAAEANDANDDLEALRDLIGEGEYATAEQQARELLSGVESEHGAESTEAAAVLDVLVEARWRGGKAFEPETRALAERALEVKTRALGPKHADVAESLNNLAVLNFFSGEYLDAKPLWERAIAIRRQSLGPDHPAVAQMMNNLANLLTMIGEYDRARQLYEGALEIREKAFGPEDVSVGDTLSNLALLLTSTGDFAAALRVSERAVEVKRKALGPEHPKVPSSLSTLGTVLWKMGDYDAARPILEEAVALYEKSLGPQHPFVGQALNNLAELLRAAGVPDEARECYERSLAILEQAYGPEHPEVGVTLDNLADLYEAGGDDTDAEALYGRAIAIREGALGPLHPDVAESLLSLGLLLAKTGQSVEALGLLERALTIREESLGPAHPQVSEALAGLAAVVAASGDTGRALELALRAELVGRDHLRLTGRSLAEQLALRYAAVRNRGLDLALSIAAGGGKLDGGREVLDSLVRSRAVVLDEMAARQRSVVGSGDPEIARLADELAEARATLANLTVRGVGNMSPETYRGLLDETRRAKEAAESRLAAASVEFAREQQRSRLGLAEVAASLPPTSALVAFVLFDRTELAAAQDPQAAAGEQTPTVRVDPARTVRYYLALVLREGGGDPVAVPLGTAEEIEPLVRRWKREVASPDLGSSAEEAEASYRRVAESLRLKIWDPVEARLAGAERVFIVPDGVLNMVSFASLPVDESKYLIESGKLLHYLSAERDLVSTSSGETAGQGLLALGGPDYDDRARVSKLDGPVRESSPGGTGVTTTRGSRASCGSFDSLRFEPLPEAAVEAEEIASLWRRAADAGAARGGVLHLAGAAASEAAFKKGAPRKQVLHLATHGFFLGGDCGSGRDRTRSRGFKVTQEEPVITGLSPLLLSGLALAGANQRAAAAAGEEDGVITAEEIASLDLSGVDWAVLSACDTGVGEIQAGEGVFGLRRAMQIAGVRTLIMSLWPVDDEATRAWMKTLYRARLSDRLDTPHAARAAGLAVMLQRREAGESTHPFYWAAFVAAGEWR